MPSPTHTTLETAARSVRRRRHHRRQRHRRRHPLYAAAQSRRWCRIPSGSCRRGLPAARSRSAGAMAYAELAALRPRAGGEYVYLREAFGPLAGFMTGWTSFVAGFAGAIAASAIFLIIRARSIHSGRGEFDAVLRHSASVRAADLLAAHAARDHRDLAVRARAHRRRRSRPRRDERARDAEGVGAAHVHRRWDFRSASGSTREPPAGGRRRSARRTGCSRSFR